MPQIALGTDEAIVRQWLVEPGRDFAEGDPLLEIETDKATMDVEAAFDGLLVAQACEEGETVAVGTVVGHATEPGGDMESALAELGAEPVAAAAPVATAAPPPATAAAPPPVSTAFREVEDGELAGLAASPAATPARRLAAPFAIDDPALAGPFEDRPVGRRRLAIARRMAVATAVPTFAVHRDVPAAAASANVTAARAAGLRATFTDVLLKALAAAATANPRTNAWMLADELREFAQVGAALAVDTSEGVVAPVVRDVEALSLGDLVARREDLVERARGQRLDARELTGGTITLSNVAGLGSHGIVPVLTLPQTAAVGVGTARPGHAGDTLTVAFVGDHRVLDGADGARFLASFAEALQTTMNV